jgi:TRAP-type C4-dicarboxylate transport system substrate-binding protein
MDEKIQAGLEKAGFVSFGFATTGFAVIMSNEPVHSLADLKGKRVWVPEGDGISKASMLALSVSPVPMPLTDVYTSLQTGGLDIIFMSSIGAVILQYHTKLKYLTDLPLVYTMGFMAVDKKAFGKISSDDQTIVREVMSGLYDKYNIENMVDDREAKEALFNAGLQRIVPEEESIAEIRAVLHESNYDLAKQDVVSLHLYEEMVQYVDEYRSEHDADVVTEKAGEQVSAFGD